MAASQKSATRLSIGKTGRRYVSSYRVLSLSRCSNVQGRQYDDICYLGGEPIALDNDETKTRLVQRLRQYLEIRNLNVLIGNGASLPLGAPRIGNIKDIRGEFDKDQFRLKDEDSQRRALALLDHLTTVNNSIGLEPMLTVLANIQSVEELLVKPLVIDARNVTANDARELERLLKKWLFHRCRALSANTAVDLRSHQELLRRILLRSTVLPRARVFTLNYDLLLERALDNIGVHYFDGFWGPSIALCGRNPIIMTFTTLVRRRKVG
jgi:hypothetical protein